MKKVLSAIAVGICFCNSISCMAAGISSISITDIPGNETTKTVTVTGVVPADADISLKVYKKGKTKANLADEALKDVIYYGKQKKADSQGIVSFDFPMSGEKGAYMVEINYSGSVAFDKLSDIFVFLPETDEMEFICALNDMHKEPDEEITDEEFDLYSGKIKDFVDNQYLIMPENYNVLSDEEKNAVFKLMMYDEDYTTIEDVPAAFTVAYNVSKLGFAENAEMVDALLKQDAEFVENVGLKDTQALAVYLDDTYVFDRMKAAEALMGDNIINSSTAKSVFEEKVVSLAVGAQTKYTIIDILTGLNDYLELDFTKYNKLKSKQERFREYISEKMPLEPTVDEIKTSFQNAVVNVLDKKESNKETNRPSSGSSSRGSSGGGGASAAYPVVQIPEKVTRKAKFEDLEGFEWAEEDIKYLFENNYIDGISETVFNPGATVKREEYLKMLVNAAKITGTKNQTAFSDVIAGAWYEKFVAIGVEKGIVNGQSDISFGIGMNVTREDMAVMMYRALKDKVTMTSEGSQNFTDSSAISEYAKEAVYCMQKLGIINGMTDGSFCPKDNATRAQAAACIRRMLKYIE